jgi:uncharacterized protein YjbI with pentapeptide repeats
MRFIGMVTDPSNGGNQGGKTGLVIGWVVSGVTALAAVAGIMLTLPQIGQVKRELDLTREGQITDRFNDAVQNIGSDKRAVRLGAVLALQRILDDSGRDQPSIVYVLCGFIQNGPTDSKESSSQGSDIQAAFEVLAARDATHDKSAQINLSNARMAQVSAAHATLPHANLEGVDWRSAKLPSADLRKSDLAKADLDGSSFEVADLRQAILREAKMNGANFQQADLRGANLRDATLAKVDFSEADLRDADLYPAKMPEADLAEADLRGVDLSEADLRGADLSGADLRGTDLRQANLSGADLDGVKVDGDTQLDSEDRRLLSD